MASARAHSIAELAQFAKDESLSNAKTVKDWLRTADALRKQGTKAKEDGDLEAAFLYFARSGTIVMEKIPNHKGYHELTQVQRSNLNANGRDIIHSMEQLKPILADRYESWAAKNPEAAKGPSQLDRLYGQSISPVVRSRAASKRESAFDAQSAQAHARTAVSTGGGPGSTSHHGGGVIPAHVVGGPQRSNSLGPTSSGPMVSPDDLARRLQQAALGPRSTSFAQQTGVGPQEQQQQADVSRRVAEMAAQKKWQQEMHEEIKRKERERAEREMQKTEVRRRAQETAVAAARNAAGFPNQPTSAYNYTMPQPKVDYPLAEGGALPHLPLQDPNLFRERSSPTTPTASSDPIPPWVFPHPSAGDDTPPSHTVPLHASAFVGGAPIEYPRLMTPHQQQQGYFPNPSPVVPIYPIRPLPQPQSQPQQSQRSAVGSSLYNVPLPQKSPPGPSTWNQQSASTGVNSYSQPAHTHTPVGPAPALPPRPTQLGGVPAADASYTQSTPQLSKPISYPSAPGSAPPAVVPTPSRSSSPTHDTNGLRLIDVPADVLSRFLSVAQMNTQRKKETCGLLLGKEKGPGRGFLLTTLLIPEQRSTGDTCTMENEELVVEFQIGRELVTIGWIHTHPTQSCFMSSLDLHTHSGYQASLQEAIAIVCAPLSQPQFGIFRLTDPGGLQTVLRCNAKEAFHPHPEGVIYTDSSHVRLMDQLPLEIVDLRRGVIDFSSSEGTARSM